jgi:hypothetical protein
LTKGKIREGFWLDPTPETRNPKPETRNLKTQAMFAAAQLALQEDPVT